MLKVNWRPVAEQDRPTLEAIQAEMNLRLGENFELPKLELAGEEGRAIMMAMVAELDGQIIGTWYVEMVAELKFCSVDPRFTAVARRDCWDQLCKDSRTNGLRFIQTPVPESKDEALNQRVGEALIDLCGMRESGCKFFIKDLG